MSQYIVSARKYRPDSFESLIGQDNIAQTLKNSILRGQLAHAYLFCGPRGVGKTSAARIFAKTINCSNPSADMEPCGECESCRSFKEGRSYCIHELDAASNNGVEDIKLLMDQVQIPPQVGRYSVYIIDEVHMLSTAAFNAFLKTLEEPPAHAIFILATTEKHKILPTILSRCQTYDFNRIGIPDIVRNLRSIATQENIAIDDESLHVIAHKADGAMRDALTIFDQTVAFCGTDIHYEDVIRNLNVLDCEYSFKLTDAFLAKDYATAMLCFDEILAKGFNALHFISALGSHLRDLLVSRTGGLESLLDLPDSLKARYQEQAMRCPVKFIYDALGIISQCEAGYRGATNQRLHIEFALMRLAFLGGLPAEQPAAVNAAAAAPVAKPAPAAAVTAPTPTAAAAPAKPVASAAVQAAAAPVAAAAVTAPTPAPAAAPTKPVQAAAPAKPAAPVAAAAPAAVHEDAVAPVAAAAAVQEAPIAPVPAPATAAATPEASAVATPAPAMAPAPEAPATASTPAANAQTPASAAPAAATPTPASAARTAAPRRSRAASLSLSALMENKEDDLIVPVEENASAQGQKSIPGIEQLSAKWAELAKLHSAQPRLANTLANAKLELQEEEGIHTLGFYVTNESQRRWIEEHILRDLEGKFQKLSGAVGLRLRPLVIPEEETEKKAYMPQEKARELMDKNSEVAHLVADLGLDIK